MFVASFIGTPQMNLIAVDLQSADSNGAKIELGGQAIRLPADPAVSRLQPSKVTIGVRPRGLTPASAAADDTIPATAELIEPMGAETLVHMRGPSNSDLRVVVPRDRRIKIGEALHLRCDPRQTHVFDANGKAVRT